jgi:hypothetical protein
MEERKEGRQRAREGGREGGRKISAKPGQNFRKAQRAT